MLKKILFLFVLALPAFGANINVAITIPDGTIPAIITYLEEAHLEAADTNANGSVSQAEALAFFTSECQKLAVQINAEAVKRAKESDPTLLPQSYQDALTAFLASQTALQAQEDLLK